MAKSYAKSIIKPRSIKQQLVSKKKHNNTSKMYEYSNFNDNKDTQNQEVTLSDTLEESSLTASEKQQ